MESKISKAVIQPRVSSREQRDEGYSLPAQEKLLRAYCEQRSIKIAKAWPITETASKPKQRRIFREMMDYVRAQDVKIIVVEKVDRLARSFVDLVAIDSWLDEDADRQVHFVKDSIVLHQASRSQEKLNWGMRVLLAKNMIDNMKEEVEKGIKEKLASGGLPGNPPPGYAAVGKVGRKELVPDDMAPLITQAFELFLQPVQSVASVHREITRRGLRTKTGRPVVIAYFHKLLSNPIYTGKIRWAGKIYNGRHAPIVDSPTFQAVQDKLTNRRTAPKYRMHDSLFRSMLKCHECGRTVSWELQRGRYYGRCKGVRQCVRRHYLREDNLEDMLIQHLDGLMAPTPEIADQAIATARQDAIELKSTEAAQKAVLERRTHDIERRTLIAYQDRLDGRITAHQYDSLVLQFKEDQEAVLAELHQTSRQVSDTFDHDLDIVKLCINAGRVYRAATKAQKRILLEEIFSNIGLEGPEVAWQWSEPVSAIAATVEGDHSLHENFEHGIFGSRKGKEALTRASFTIWQGLTSYLRTRNDSWPGSARRVRELLDLLDDAPQS